MGSLWLGSTGLSSGGGLYAGYASFSAGGGLSPDGGTPAPSPTNPDITINAEGWSSTWNSGTPPTFDPAGSPVNLTVQRAGYNASGSTATHTDTLVLTERMRTPYVATVPNTQLSTNQVALSDYVYSTDTVPDRTNNSTVASPKPAANWTRLARTTVYGAGPLVSAVGVAHRDARNGLEAACVEFTATDSVGTTVTQRIAVPTIGGLPLDRYPIEEYVCSIDTTSLAVGWIKLDAAVKPWVGTASSIADSATDGRRWEGFSTRWFYKRAARVVCYVSGAAYTSGVDSVPLGVNATGRWSANIATAKANPFLTVRGAMDGVLLAANTTETGSICDGLEIRLGGTAGREYQLQGRASGSLNQVSGALVITRDPEIGIDDVQATFGTTQYAPAIALTGPAGVTRAAVLFKDVKIKRTGTSTFSATGGANWDALIDHPRYDRNAIGTTFGAYPGIGMYIQGIDLYDGASPSESAVSLTAAVMVRGVVINVAGGNMPQLHVNLGCVFKDTNGPATPQSNITEAGGDVYNIIFDGMEVTSVTTPAAWLSVGANYNVYNAKFKNFIGVDLRNDGGSSFAGSFSRDAQTGNLTHVCLRHMLGASAYTQARWNLFYCDVQPAGSENRSHTLNSMRGCLISEINCKSDLFNTQSPPKTGNWSFVYGVGCYGNWTMYSSGSSDGTNNGFKIYSQQYSGLFSYYPATATALTSQLVAPGFVDYRATTNSGDPSAPTYAAGTAGGDYRIGSGGAAKGLLPARYACRLYDADGLAVTGNDTPGAWR